MRLCLTLLVVVLVCGCGKQVPLPGFTSPKVITPSPTPTRKTGANVAKDESPTKAQPEQKAPAEPSTSEKALTAEKATAADKEQVAAADTGAPAEAKEAEILFTDSFADQKGAVKKNADGKTKQEVEGNTRLVHMFRGTAEEGTLLLQVFEDPKTVGPDEKPGVLALSWQEVPGKLPYSGFTYLGRAAAGERMTLPPLQGAKTAEDLAAYHLSFRHRAVNVKAAASDPPPETDKPKDDKPKTDKPKEALKIPINWRLEPMLPDSYNKRLDLGKFTATDEWGTVDVCLKDGTNAAAFFKALADEHPTAFKIVWAQGAAIGSYHAGDTLLIDDIAVKKGSP